MVSYSNETNNIKGKIASLKAISDKSSKKYEKNVTEIKSLMGSITNIIAQLGGGYDEIIQSIQTILSEKLDDIEEIIKSAIKISIKQTISCGVDPSIGDDLINDGITFELDKIDTLSILTIDPQSENGSYIYFDNLSGVNSDDFNVYLYTIIKNTLKNKTYNGDVWYKSDIENNERVLKPLLRTTYKEYNPETFKSNLLTIKIDKSFKGKKISYFISEYLDSIKLYDSVQIISTIFDEILGAKIISTNKTSNQLLKEKQIRGIIDNLINNIEDENEVVDESYYQFSNETYDILIKETENKRLGKISYGANNNTIEVNRDVLLDNLNGLKVNDLSIKEQTNILNNTINEVAKNLSENSFIRKSDEQSFKEDLVNSILSEIMNTMSAVILSPKITFLFSMTSRIFGIQDEDNMIEFIKKNINIYKLIILNIREIIMKILLDKIKQLLSPMINNMIKELAKEKLSIYKKQLLSIKNIL